MGKHQPDGERHYLSNVGEIYGLCCICGWTEVVQREQGARCRTAWLSGKSRTRRYEHGLTREEANNYKALIGECEICGNENNLVVDHNHQTGQLRGVLCVYCNTKFAAIEDDDWLKAALRYKDDYS